MFGRALGYNLDLRKSRTVTVLQADPFEEFYPSLCACRSTLYWIVKASRFHDPDEEQAAR